MLLSWGRELQFVCLACLPIPDINAYPFFTFIFFYFMGYTYVEVYSLQELKSPCPPRGTWGSSSVVGLGVGKHLYPPGHLARPVPGALIRIVSSLPAVSALGKLTNWTWHPLRAVWLSRQIRALSMILQTGTKWWRFFFTPLSMLRSGLRDVHTQIWSLLMKISVRQRKCWRESRSKGEAHE